MSVAPVLDVLVAGHLGEFDAQSSAARDGDPHGVHQARVATRRLREVLPVAFAAAEAGRRRKIAKRARRFTRALGPVRELDVALGLTDELVAQHPSLAGALNATRQHLSAARDTCRGSMLAVIDPVSIEKLHAAIGRLRTRTDDDGLRWRRLLSERVSARASALRDALDDTGVLYAPERLHAVRIAAKKLRYTLELVGDARLAANARTVKALKKAQDALGHLHDLQVLTHHVDRVREQEQGDAGLASQLAELHGVLDEQCRALHAAYLPSRAGLRKIADSASDVVAPRILSPVPARSAAAKRSRVA